MLYTKTKDRLEEYLTKVNKIIKDTECLIISKEETNESKVDKLKGEERNMKETLGTFITTFKASLKKGVLKIKDVYVSGVPTIQYAALCNTTFNSASICWAPLIDLPKISYELEMRKKNNDDDENKFTCIYNGMIKSTKSID